MKLISFKRDYFQFSDECLEEYLSEFENNKEVKLEDCSFNLFNSDLGIGIKLSNYNPNITYAELILYSSNAIEFSDDYIYQTTISKIEKPLNEITVCKLKEICNNANKKLKIFLISELQEFIDKNIIIGE